MPLLMGLLRDKLLDLSSDSSDSSSDDDDHDDHDQQQPAARMHLFRRLKILGLADADQITGMRRRMQEAPDQFTMGHFEKIWASQLVKVENRRLGRASQDKAVSVSAKMSPAANGGPNTIHSTERSRHLSAFEQKSNTAETGSSTTVKPRAGVLARSLIARKRELEMAGLVGSGSTAVWCGDLPESRSTKAYVWALFSAYGKIKNVFIRRKVHPSRSWGIITYGSAASVGRALASALSVRDSDGTCVQLRVQPLRILQELAKSQPGTLGEVVKAALEDTTTARYDISAPQVRSHLLTSKPELEICMYWIES